MKFSQLLIALSILLLLANCQSPSDQIKDAFDTVNKSLEESNRLMDNSIESIYITIDSIRKEDQTIALHADTIFFAAKHANDYIDRLKGVLELKDSAGTNLSVATKLFVLTPTGDSLHRILLKVYTSAKSYPISNVRQGELDSVLQGFQEIRINKEWTKVYFENTPTVGAKTILSKFQGDCKMAATIVLKDIKKRLTD